MRKLLAILILLLFPVSALSATIFDESFENGFGIFTEGEGNDPSVVFVTTDATAPDGTHDVEFVFESGMSDGEAPGHINGPISGNPSEIYSRFYFKLSSGFQWHDYEQKLVFYWGDGISGAGNFYISIGTWGDHKMFGCIQGDGTTYRNASGPTITTGRWYKVDVHLAASGGVFQLWLDDQLVLNFTGVPLGSGGWWRMALRPIYGGYYPGTAGDVPQTQYMWMDRAIVSTTAIGTTPPPPPPPAPSGAPYTSSTSILGITWDFVNKIQSAVGSDLWPVTWAGDDSVYALWGDGGGFNGSNTLCRTVFGVGKLTGTPPSFSYTNVYGCNASGGCDTANGGVANSACNAQYSSTVGSEYGDIVVALDNTLYAIVYEKTTPPRQRIMKSTDFGHSWTKLSWVWSLATGAFSPSGFVQYGKGNADAVDSYVYLVGGKVGTMTQTYLARVPVGSVETQASYQYVTSSNPTSPTWGSWGSAVPIFTNTNKTNTSGQLGGKMIYIKALGRYVFTQSHDVMHNLGVYDAPNPWGPWTTVYYSDTWGNYGTSNALWYSIVPKWVSADGRTFWMTFSGDSAGSISMDSFNLIKGTFILPQGPAPAAPGAMFIGSGAFDFH